MKVFFLGDRLDSTSLPRYKEIISILKEFGENIDTSWIDADPKTDAENFEKAYERTMNSIKLADVIIAETTEFSSGIGFSIAKALSEKKPVLALHYEKSNNLPSTTLKGSSKSKLLKFELYTDETLKKIIRNFINNAKRLLDTKFILIISPEIDRYLEWAADEKRMHKAQIVREAVEDMMGKDQEYRKSIKDEA